MVLGLGVRDEAGVARGTGGGGVAVPGGRGGGLRRLCGTRPVAGRQWLPRGGTQRVARGVPGVDRRRAGAGGRDGGGGGARGVHGDARGGGVRGRGGAAVGGPGRGGGVRGG